MSETTTAADSSASTITVNAGSTRWSPAFLRQYHVKAFRDKWAEDTLLMSIAIQVREIRLQRGWTQQELAEKASLTQPQISRVESGIYQGTIDVLQRIAAAFNCALMVRFVTHGEYLGFILKIMAEGIDLVPTFDEETAALEGEQSKVEIK